MKRSIKQITLPFVGPIMMLALIADFACSGAASAQQARVATSSTTRIVTLGTVAGPVARAKRSGSANLLTVGDRNYLIDAGPGVAHALARAGLQPADIHTIFLTHLHFDHIGGLATLLGYAWVWQNGSIEVYGPPATAAFVEAAKQYLLIPERIYQAQMPPVTPLAKLVQAHEIDVQTPAIVYQDDKLKVTAVENTHFSTFLPANRPLGTARSYAYRFDTADRSIVFTGDTGPSAAVERLAKGADVLVSEVMDMGEVIAAMRRKLNVPDDKLKATLDHMLKEHLSSQEVGRLARRAGVKMVVLTHVGMGLDSETDMRQYTDGVRAEFAGPVVMAHDGTEF